MNINSFNYNKEEFNNKIEEVNNFYYSKEEDDDDGNSAPNVGKKVILPALGVAGAAYAGNKLYKKYMEKPIPEKDLKKKEGVIKRYYKHPIKQSLKIAVPVGTAYGVDKVFNKGRATEAISDFSKGVMELGKNGFAALRELGKHVH
jgi:antirestriction protein